MPKKRKATDNQIQQLIIKYMGNISLVADRLGMNRSRLSSRIHSTPHLVEVLNESRERADDFVMSKFFQNINEGKEKSILFYLERRIDEFKPKVEVLTENKFENFTDEQLRKMLE